MDGGPAAHQGGPVARLELLEAAAVHGAGDDLSDVEGDPDVDGADAEQLIGVVGRLVDTPVEAQPGRSGPVLAPAQVGDDLPTDADGVALVLGQVVAHAGGGGVHLGAAE